MEFDEPAPTLAVCFSTLEDPRIDRTKKYPLVEVVFLTIVAVLCGADSWQQIVLVGRHKIDWLRKFFPFLHGIPSHDTIGRVFSLIDPIQFQGCFLDWVGEIAKVTGGEIIAIDGKKSRNSHDTYSDSPALYLVSAWAESNGVSLGQVKVADKSNEITAIPRILDLIDVKGAIVTIDAMGAQKAITQKITEQEADFVIGLKDNQPKLSREVCAFFEAKRLEYEGLSDYHIKQTDSGHGRVETRECYHLPIDLDWVPSATEWVGLNSIIVIESERFVKSKEITSTETRFYISSLAPDPKSALRATRGHWAIENNLHWCLDVAFGDDQCRIRKDHAPQNYAIIKKWVLGLLKKDRTKNGLSLKSKRLRAAIDASYLETLVCQLE